MQRRDFQGQTLGCQEGPGSSLVPLSFAEMPGWAEDDSGAAFRCFRAGAAHAAHAPPKTRSLGIPGGHLQRVAALALLEPATLSGSAARRFFEAHFRPFRIAPAGFVTGYYEPELPASRVRQAGFTVPLYRRPPDLCEIAAGDEPPGWDPAVRFARIGANGPEPYHDRAAIEAGALAGRGLELAWLADPVDAYFVHVQGSARLRLASGGTMRVAFDGKSGHPYTSIGRLAVERGILTGEEAHKEGLEAWMRANAGEARRLMAENRSFIFFRQVELGDDDGPMGAAGIPLTPGRSLAVDRTLMTFHTPIWVEAPGLTDSGRPYARLMIAQDTGSAIVGLARGDLFFGSGAAAGAAAGRVRHAAAMTVLMPAAAI